VAALAARGFGAFFAESGAGAPGQMSHGTFSFSRGGSFFDISAGSGPLFCGCHTANRMTLVGGKGTGFIPQGKEGITGFVDLSRRCSHKQSFGLRIRSNRRIAQEWTERYRRVMALVRILVDGYSLLHNWPQLARGKARHSAFAREELIRRLTLYQDAIGTPITIFFDGQGARVGTPDASSKAELEVLYSRAGQTADQMIERATYRFRDYGEVLAVTDDFAEQDTVTSLGGMASSCMNFIQTVENTLAEMVDDLKQRNRQERQRFHRKA